MLRTLLISALLMIPASAWSRGDVVGNGIGLAEKRFHYVFQNIESFVGLCLSGNLCKLTASEQALALKILEAMPQERLQKKPLQFESEKKRPGFFVIDGKVKAAKTGPRIGVPIYINLDMTVRQTFYGSSEPMGEPEVLSILMHELGHHHGIEDEDQLDIFGSKFQTALAAELQRVELGFHAANVQVSVLNTPALGVLPQVWITDGLQMFDLSHMVLPYLTCPAGYTMSGGHISNTHWSWKTTPDPTYPAVWYIWIEGFAMPYCTRGGVYQSVSQGSLFKIGMALSFQNTYYFVVPGSFFHN
ncbi:MAG: hypothetical protein H6624_01395 [Bdellovibrionaceae bacterium]|nr:hypothetical protein [Pseudobdellovibrionaceae bacterium]